MDSYLWVWRECFGERRGTHPHTTLSPSRIHISPSLILYKPLITLTMCGCLGHPQLRGIVAQPLAAQSLSRVQVQQQAQAQNVQPHHARRQEGGRFVVSRLCIYIHDPYIYMTLHHPQPPSFHPQPPCNHLGNPRPNLIEPWHRQAQPRSIRGVYATQCAITLSRGNPTL